MTSKNCKSIIVGIKSFTLSREERSTLSKIKPWGIILFSRNVKNIYQLKKLVLEIKKLFNDDHYPILIDQEGGRVSRLNKIINLSFFSQGYFGKMFTENKNFFLNNYTAYVKQTCDILNLTGININTVPVLDVIQKKTNKIIGDRSFSNNSNTVSKLGKISTELFQMNKIACVMKHIPGHGQAIFDSHKKVSVVKATKEVLFKKDFFPFINNKALFAMTAHIIYNQYDPNYTATHSKIVINQIIRKKIGFSGILMTDDISMKSLKFGILENTKKALDAGCNLILHCNGNLSEIREISKFIPKIDNFIEKKTSQFRSFLR